MVLDEAETTKFFRVRRTLMEMLKARNYLVADYEIEMTKQQVMKKYGENVTTKDLIINKARRNDNSDQEEELLFNVTKHVLLPKHQVLTDEEKKALLEKYRVKQSQNTWGNLNIN
ncbi:DNA-directed RNA polymerase RPB5 subunit, eukaryote/virus [Parasponia andersonii]|uniref:DNA-directed RNA polymerase RPB5 subunit, eukaryote/virus n=1 Tax=Parasponia andersonii TaxID=3476 RepID=A0A2P5CMP7_PARAD|nr:DNA-directed RNA polymerase RPB5 subunit, eukaryote/virus [Parasponia andersonii]